MGVIVGTVTGALYIFWDNKAMANRAHRDNKQIYSDIMSKVSPDKNGCWLWNGHREGPLGYARCSINGKNAVIHRWMYCYVNSASLNKEQFVCHSCDVPNCVNPSHLFLGDSLINSQDRHQKGRTKGTFKSGLNHPFLKVPKEQYANIKELYAGGNSQTKISRMYGCSDSLIWLIVHDRIGEKNV